MQSFSMVLAEAGIQEHLRAGGRESWRVCMPFKRFGIDSLGSEVIL